MLPLKPTRALMQWWSTWERRVARPFTLILVALMLGSCPAFAKPVRSAAPVLAFKRANACPSTGAHRGSCPGYVIDHVYPLCAGGADDPSNMQYQTQDAARRKDRWERQLCRGLRKHH
jgi:hypothetical protein